MVDCADNTPESNEVVAARLVAAMDVILGKDSTAAVSEAFGVNAQLHYAARASELQAEKPQIKGPAESKPGLESPYKKYFDNESLNTTANMITGLHPDINVASPSILGDDIVRPVEDAHRAYQEASHHLQQEPGWEKLPEDEQRDKIVGAKEDSGYFDAVATASEEIEHQFENDPDRLEYGRAWIKEVSNPDISKSFPGTAIRQMSNNFVENSLKNNTVSSLRNYTDRARALYQYGATNYVQGEKLFKQAMKANSPELKESGILGNRFYEQKGPDLFEASEPGNKGITYFAAKLHAKANGMNESDARIYGRKAIEQLQFQHSYITKPRAYWGSWGRTNLSLLSFGLSERRWYLSLWHGLGNPATRQNSLKTILMYSVGNALINGWTANMPEEVGALWKHFFPTSYKAMRQGDRISLAGALDIDLAEISRIPLTGPGYLLKVPQIWSNISKETEKIGNLINHPEKPINWLRGFSAGYMLLPAGWGLNKITAGVAKHIGNKNLAAMTEWLYRTTQGDYNRTSQGKKYTTSFKEETMNMVRSGRESLTRHLSNTRGQ